MIDGWVFEKGGFFYFRPQIQSQQPEAWGGRWDSSLRAWRLPRLACVVDRLEKAFPNALWPDDSEAWRSSPWMFPRCDGSSSHPSWGRLFSFQREGVDFLVSSPLPGGMLALSPGLGKTAVAVIAAESLELSRVLVIAPLSLLKTWVREIHLWSRHAKDASVETAYGTGPGESVWTVTNYDTVVGKRFFELYARQKWDVIVVDESILVKNRDTNRFKQLRALRGNAARIWELSGSPISRYVDDLWAQFALLAPQYFTSYWRFAESYCVMGHSPWSQYEILGSRLDIDLRHEFRDIMFVKNQREVLDLPDFIPMTIDLDIHEAQKKAYNELVDSFRTEIDQGESLSVTTVLALLTRLQEITSNLFNVSTLDISTKADAVVEIVKEGLYEFPMLIWVHWRRGAEALYNRLRHLGDNLRVALVLGGEGQRAAEMIERYMKGEFDVLILSIGVGKYGHTLTNTKTAIYLDKTWDMDAWIQSKRRVQRIGLSHSPVLISLRVPGSIDEYVEDNLAGKAPAVAQVSNEDLGQLLQGIVRHLDG